MKRLPFVVAGMIFASQASACASESAASAVAAPAKSEVQTMGTPTEDGGVANLPFAHGKVFYSLDEYLAHLEKNSAIDLPWWREIRPGVYEHMIRMPGAEQETATREELMRRFRFKR